MVQADTIAGGSVTADSREVRLLVVIASYGERNLDFLKRIIGVYQSLPMKVSVVVVSNAPKDLGSEVKVAVGLPSSNPWSLPFAHKPIFAENLDAYDLFIYSEDDIAITERNIRAFMELTPELAGDEIAGFLRYEVDKSGVWSFPEAHGVHHWKTNSVRQRGAFTIAEFSNEHAAFYVLTREQLRRAIASGGFLRAPYAGKYDMLCSAATDPYTSCGFHKVVSISNPEDFFVHHLSNRYTGEIGISVQEFQEQVKSLREAGGWERARAPLGVGEPKVGNGRWAKAYYEPANERLLNVVPSGAKKILAVGCGSGALEVALKQRGAEVTALPLDAVIGTSAARQGIKLVYGSLAEGFEQLAGKKFDCVIVTNLLHLFANPAELLAKCAEALGAGGVLMVTGPNFERLPLLVKATFNVGEFGRLKDFKSGGVQAFGIGQLSNWIRQAGLEPGKPVWGKRQGELTSGAHGFWYLLRRKFKKALANGPGRFSAETWLVVSRKANSAGS